MSTYKTQRSLKTHKGGWNIDYLKKLIVILLIGNIVVVIYFGVSIKKDLSFMQQENSSLYTNVMNQVIMQGNQFKEDLANSVTQSNNDVQYHAFQVSNLNFEDGTADVSFDVTLKQANGNSTVLAIFTGLETAEVHRFELNSIESLNYSGKFSISILENYEVQIIEQGSDGLNRVLNELPIAFLIYNEYYANRVQIFGSGFSMSDDELIVSYELGFSKGEQDAVNLAKVMLQAWEQENLIAEYDITEQLTAHEISPNLFPRITF